MLELITILYFLPVLFSFIVLYFDEGIQTVGDFFNNIEICFIPLINIICVLIYTIEYLDVLFKKLINTKRFKRIMKVKIYKISRLKLYKPTLL